MPTFRTAEDLTRHYAVSPERLLTYAQRGNLSMRKLGDELWFDEEAVARLFPKRTGDADATPGQRLGSGVLGTATLGPSLP